MRVHAEIDLGDDGKNDQSDPADAKRTADSDLESVRSLEREAIACLNMYRQGLRIPALSEEEEIEALAKPEEKALQCLRYYQETCGIPPLTEDEERTVLHWIVQGGRVPDSLQLDKISASPSGHSEGIRHMVAAQFYLLIAIARELGKRTAIEDIPNLGATFALAALEKLRAGHNPGAIILEVVDRVSVTMVSPHELQ